MPIRTLTAPGVEIHEIDKSLYSKSMTGSSVLVPLFSDKGEPYKYKAITSRTSFELMNGVPQTEAERYGYAAVTEALNQNANLFVARLPYDNASFEKMVGVKYRLTMKENYGELDPERGKYRDISKEDPEIKDAIVIEGGKTPVLYDLSAVDEYRTNENRVPANTFLIVDKTGGTYQKVTEDSRKGQRREVIGIVPVVTTAANAMFAQKLISADLSAVKFYEPLAGQRLQSLKAVDSEGNVVEIDGEQMQNEGLSSCDLVQMLNTEQFFTNVTSYTGMKLVAEDTVSSGILSEQDALDFIESDPIKYKDCCVSSYVPKIVVSGKMNGPVKKYFVVLSANDEENPDPRLDEVNQELTASGQLFYCESDAEAEAIKRTHAAGIDEDLFYMTAEVVEHVEPLKFERSFESDEEVKAFKEENKDSLVGNLVVTRPDEEGIGEEYFAVVRAKWLEDQNIPLDPSDSRYGWHGQHGDDSVPDTMSLDASQYFSTIQPAQDGEGGFDSEHLKDIGLVVYKMYLDPSEGNKVGYEAVEAYCGSLFKDDKDPNTGVSKFLDDIVNSNSNYVNFFSNCFASKASQAFYKNTCDIMIMKPAEGATLGFYSAMTKKDISVSKSILDGLNKVFDKAGDVNELDIDVVCDAGVSNIASYLKCLFGDKGPYDLMITDDLGNSMLGMWKCQKGTDKGVKIWKSVVNKIDNFCKNMRKDCMFATDCPRPMVLQGQRKIIRDTKPANTIDGMIIPYLPALAGINTSYGAGYMCWFELADDYSGDFFWCPPSIKAMGAYVNTDVNFEYWDSPAGLTRGVVNALDVAFSPNAKQAGMIYEKSWNFAINYTLDGIVIDG